MGGCGDESPTKPAREIDREKTGPLRARFQFVGAGADITFQRGTTADNVRRDLGGWATVRRQ
jgi:hypothetical protein